MLRTSLSILYLLTVSPVCVQAASQAPPTSAINDLSADIANRTQSMLAEQAAAANKQQEANESQDPGKKAELLQQAADHSKKAAEHAAQIQANQTALQAA